MRIRRFAVVLWLLLAAAGGLGSRAYGQWASFTSTDNLPGWLPGGYPRAVSGSRILGDLVTPTTSTYFIYDGTQSTVLQAPGATWMGVTGIDGQRAVGDYRDAAGTHHFLYDGTNYTNLNVPGTPHGIDGNLIVGSYGNSQTGYYGYVYNITTSTWMQLQAPDSLVGFGVTGTGAIDASGNKILATCDDWSGREFALVYDLSTSTWTRLGPSYHYGYDSYPTAISGNLIAGVDNFDPFGADTWTPWIYNLQTPSFTTLTFPPGMDGQAGGIDGYTVVGSYTDATMHGYGFIGVLSPEPETVALMTIGFSPLDSGQAAWLMWLVTRSG